MKQNLFVVSSDEITQIEFDSEKASFEKISSLPVDEKVGFMLRYENLLFVAFETKIVSYEVNREGFHELSSVLCDGFSPCHLEYVPSSSALLAAGGEGGKNAVYSVIDGRLLPHPHVFIHSYTDENGITHQGGFASCNKATNNPYRIASLEKDTGIAIIANLFNQNGLSVRECSRIIVGKDKGISDIVFTNTDIAYILCEKSGELILTDFHAGSGSLWPLKIVQFSNAFSKPQMYLSNDSRKLFCLDSNENNFYIFNLNVFSVKDIHKFSLSHITKYFCIPSDGKYLFTSGENKIFVYLIANDSLEKISEYNIRDPKMIII